MVKISKHQTVFFLTLLAGCALLFVVSFLFPTGVHAASIIPPDGIVPQCLWNQGETYGLGAFVLLAANIMKLIWGIAGSLALLMFVWGGFLWLTAAGEESRVKAGWDTFMNATIGILIILGSWVIINTVILFLVNPGTTFTAATLFNGRTWVQIATENNLVCIKSADLARGSVPAAPSSSSSSSGKGICCYNNSIGPVYHSDHLTEDECAEYARGPIVLSGYNIIFCPGGVDGSVCGTKSTVIGGAGGETWNSSCAGQVLISKIAKNGRCDVFTTRMVCEKGTVCQEASITKEKRCVAEDEDVVCCKIAEGTLRGSPSTKDEFGYFSGATTRSACQSDKTVPPGGVYGGQTYDYVYKKTLMCPKASHSSCPAGVAGFAVNPLKDGDCIWMP